MRSPLLLASVLAACGGGSELPADTTDASTDGTSPTDSSAETSADVRGAFEAAGFTVGDGKFEWLDLSACCAAGSSCFGNNPSSPYASYRLPRAPGQTLANPNESADGTSVRWLLRPDEVVVWMGALPPKARYFGFTNYLFGRPNPTTGKRAPVFASLDETRNQQVIHHAGDGEPFGKTAVVLHGADANAIAKAKAALVASGIAESAIDVAPIDAVTSHPGLTADADDYSVLFRVALFDDAAAGKSWIEASGTSAKVYRLTPKAAGATSPYGLPTARPKDKGVEPASLSTAVDDLEKAVIAKYTATHAPTTMPVNDGKPDPYACISGTSQCAGDNRDALYPRTNIPFRWLESEEDFLVVLGVDHTKTNKATYTSATVYALDNLVGIASVTSAQWGGSARDWVTSPEADQLFAWKIARKCNGEPHCLEIPAGDCPSGMTAGQFSAVAFRVYVEPKTSTAPDPATLVRERVIRFKKR